MKLHKDGTSPVGTNKIFVFGSNLAGRHGAGAARAARELFGAVYGVAEGITGQAYAIPTCDQEIRPLTLHQIRRGVECFLAYAHAHPEQEFFVTRIGCVLGGQSNADVAPLFKGAPDNCSFAEEWAPFLEG